MKSEKDKNIDKKAAISNLQDELKDAGKKKSKTANKQRPQQRTKNADTRKQPEMNLDEEQKAAELTKEDQSCEN